MTYDSERLFQYIGIGAWLLGSVGAFGLLLYGGRRALRSFLVAELVVQAVAALILGGVLFTPIVRGAPPPPAGRASMGIPGYDYSGWAKLIVQEGGRKKPFESAAVENLRSITGRSTFQKSKAVPIVLQWMLLHGEGFDAARPWEREPFLLCPDGYLREKIYQEVLGPDAVLTEEHKRGKFIEPETLRKSEVFVQLVNSAEDKQRDHGEQARMAFTHLEEKAREVRQRLFSFDAISQNNPTSFGKLQHRGLSDPINLVALDQRGGGWFSIAMLRQLKDDDDRQQERLRNQFVRPTGFSFTGVSLDQSLQDLLLKGTVGSFLVMDERLESRWRQIMKERLSKVPQLYISPERLQALQAFQEQIKNGTAKQTLDELAKEMEPRREAEATRLRVLAMTDVQTFIRELQQMAITDEDRRQLLLTKEFAELHKQKPDELPPLSQVLSRLLGERDQRVIADLEARIASAQRLRYHPEDERFRMLHLNYLENRFPNVYVESSAWQPYPREDVNRVLASFTDVQRAYKTGDAYEFEQASEAFFGTVREVSEKYDRERGYPGVATAELEMRFNRVKPFMWGWISMLGCIVLLISSLSASRFERHLPSKIFYGLGWLLYVGSLGLQVFGFYARVSISGRPPVSNLYETVIFVAGMSAVFALLLELKYRRVVIMLSGALAACFALILADQLPTVLNDRIDPLVPVLRSNWWLIIHVLTIVASYAGGALAWVIGNIALGMLAFGKPTRETLKSMSQFSYRAMQIAVLLLAAGTFLGGWWAAESWGRFWGWDPKEVWALISLVCYVIPLHARYVGWVKDFGLAVSAVLCFAAIMMSWFGVNFVLPAGLHFYGFGSGGTGWVAFAALLNLVFLLTCCLRYLGRTTPSGAAMRDTTKTELVEV